MLKRQNCAKSFQTPTSSRQHNNINLFPYTTTTARPPTAVININNPMHHPTATSLQQHPCCLPQQPHGRQWQQDGRVEGEWGEWVEGERETGKVTTTQCATHMPCQLFLSLHVVWWHNMQPTCCVIYLIPSMLFDEPHYLSIFSGKHLLRKLSLLWALHPVGSWQVVRKYSEGCLPFLLPPLFLFGNLFSFYFNLMPQTPVSSLNYQ